MPDGTKKTRINEIIHEGEKPRDSAAPEHKEKREKPSRKKTETVQISGEEKAVPSLKVSKTTAAIFQKKSPLLEDIEGVLAQGLADTYKSLSPEQKAQFKAEGEKTARKIEVVLTKARVKVTEIIALIRQWLSLIPGVNRFFIEKESKIKADKILMLKEDQEEHS